VRPWKPPGATSAGGDATGISATNAPSGLTGVATNAPLIRDYSRKHGVFPLWSYATSSTPVRNKSQMKGSVGVLLYDCRHEVGPSPGEKSGILNDYTRACVLWRLWHYERRNGNVSVDVFPSISYDRKTDGFRRISCLWRFYRYERAADGRKKLDVLFVPLMRQ
jgi:hypothetical protein